MSPTSPSSWAVFCAAALGLFVGCRDADDSVRGAAAPAQSRVAASSPVVARVNGAPVYAADVRLQLGGGGDRRRALREALRFELLAQEAARRGLDGHREVARMRKRALANLFVRRTFGDSFTKQSIPERLVRRAYELNAMSYDRDELVRISYLAISARAADPAEKRRAARKLAERASTALRGRRAPDPAEFKRVVGEIVAEAQRAGLRAGVSAMTVERLKDGGIKPVVDVAFGMRPGTVSAPIRTDKGYYVVRLNERLPEVRRPLAAVDAEIRTRIFEEARAIVFEELMQRLEHEHQVRVRTDALSLLAENPGGAR